MFVSIVKSQPHLSWEAHPPCLSEIILPVLGFLFRIWFLWRVRSMSLGCLVLLPSPPNMLEANKYLLMLTRWTEPERPAFTSLSCSLWGIFISVCETYIKKLFSLNSQALKGTGVLFGEPWDHASLIWLLIISCQTFHRHNSPHTHDFQTLSQLPGRPYPWSLKAYPLLYEVLLQDGIKHAVNVSMSHRRTQRD